MHWTHPMIRAPLFSLGAAALLAFGNPSVFAQAGHRIRPPSPVAAPSSNETFIVESVLDGDTVILRGVKERVRLANIDAPEMSHGHGRPGQPFSVQATSWMEQRVEGKQVTVHCPDQDRYGRRVCDLFMDGTHVNKKLVRAGLAWANTASRRYLRDPSVLDAQSEAQQKQRGLWAHKHPKPPWQWRQDCWEKQVCSPEL